jgi:transposase InsO family protein
MLFHERGPQRRQVRQAEADRHVDLELPDRLAGVRGDYGITASMSRRGNCWVNACSETLFGSLKV